MDGELDQIIEQLRTLDGVGVAIAEEARPELLAEARRTADAGTTPDGAPWAPKKDGGRALPNAAAAITAVVSGATSAVITLILRAPYTYFHRAKAKGRRRQILPAPANGIPQGMHDAIARAAARVTARVMGVRR